MTTLPPITSVAIIGAGAGGLVTLRALLAERSFQTIDVLEQRGVPGGVWNYTAEVSAAPLPSTEPTVAAAGDRPVQARNSNNRDPVFVSAMYDLLETNIPKPLMRFSMAPPLDARLQLFPAHDDIARYVHAYARDLAPWITYHTRVTDVRRRGGPGAPWTVTMEDTRTGGSRTVREYDAVVVAAGHYNVPYVPDVSGMREWAVAHPGSISHAKFYRRPEKFAGRKVVVVGNAASGLDIAAQIARCARLPVLQSCHSNSYLNTGMPPEVREVPEITRFEPRGRIVHFADGTEESGVDAVVYATGYLHSLPFLNTGPNPALITNGERVHHLFQHIFYAPDPTLALVGLPIKVIPFVVSEAQACVVARVFSRRLRLPSRDAMRAWELAEVRERGDGRHFHHLNFPKDADYLDLLCRMVDRCDRGSGSGELPPSSPPNNRDDDDDDDDDDDVSSGDESNKRKRGEGKKGGRKKERDEDGDGFAVPLSSEHSSVGMQPQRWGPKERWLRERFPRIRKAFVDRRRRQGLVARTIEEVGFDYERGLDGAGWEDRFDRSLAKL